jgi:outer membrane protein assembly factor BamA
VDFNEIFAGSQYLQRSQSVTPYLQYALTPVMRLRGGLRFENTFTNSVSSSFQLDHGRNVLGEIGAFRNTLQEGGAYPRGGAASLTLSHSFKNLGSDYNYTQTELNFRRYFYFLEHHSVEYQLLAGYPLETEQRPLTSIYYAGGYRLLRGYNYKEFRGDALVYNGLTYHVPLVEHTPPKIWGIPLAIVTWNFFFESAKIGDRHIYGTMEGLKCSVGTGIGYRVVLLGRYPVQLELAVAKAFDPRDPQFYLTLSSIYYTWRSE